MNVLIIGLGSIAKKHIKALHQAKPDVSIYALRRPASTSVEDGVTNVYDWSEIPKDLRFILISNPTSEHNKTITDCLELGVPLFIEKPPLMQLEGAEVLSKQIEEKDLRTYCAFNFRFHPLIQWLKDNLPVAQVNEVQAYCGSYLPDWRPGRDYRQVYSAIEALGGGVHLDLIHELDYLIWLFGLPVKAFAHRGKVSELAIDSSDIAHYWLEYPTSRTSVILNYFRRRPKRTIEIVMDEDTWHANLLDCTVRNDGGEIIFSTDYDVMDSYNGQMAYFIGKLESDEPYMNSFAEALKTLHVCLD